MKKQAVLTLEQSFNQRRNGKQVVEASKGE
jgi:hypothetical protein